MLLQKKDPLNLTGKVAVITGSGGGIGWGVAQLLSAYGAAVAMIDVSDKTEERAQELRDAGRQAAFFKCDVTNEESVT
ncbi:MAG: SDR family NAD(P)-dependent oxidoreductase, partial [Oscillospiraceae bacterium]